jgi:COP9 signalosome complex subunit 1
MIAWHKMTMEKMLLSIFPQDLDAYANGYAGYAKLVRLLYVAEHCPPLRAESLKMALQHVMNTYNVAGYQQIHQKLAEIVG